MGMGISLSSNWLPVATQAEAEAGALNDRSMTPLRTTEAITALGGLQWPFTSPDGKIQIGAANTAAATGTKINLNLDGTSSFNGDITLDVNHSIEIVDIGNQGQSYGSFGYGYSGPGIYDSNCPLAAISIYQGCPNITDYQGSGTGSVGGGLTGFSIFDAGGGTITASEGAVTLTDALGASVTVSSGQITFSDGFSATAGSDSIGGFGIYDSTGANISITGGVGLIAAGGASVGASVDGAAMSSGVGSGVYCDVTGVSISGVVTINDAFILAPGAAPSSPTDGQIWYDSGSNTFKGRINGATKTFSLS